MDWTCSCTWPSGLRSVSWPARCSKPAAPPKGCAGDLTRSSRLFPMRSRSMMRRAEASGSTVRHTNCSALRQAELEAAAHARQLEAILEAMTDAVVVHDSEGQVTLLNAAAERIHPLGWTVYASQTLPQRGSQFLPRDEQGQPLPVEQWPLQRILH